DIGRVSSKRPEPHLLSPVHCRPTRASRRECCHPFLLASGDRPGKPGQYPGGSMERATGDDAFERLAGQFLAGWLAREPVRATEVGEHRYDSRWPDLGAQGEAQARAFLAATRRELGAHPRDALGQEARVDHALIENLLALGEFDLDQQRPWETDPVE